MAYASGLVESGVDSSSATHGDTGVESRDTVSLIALIALAALLSFVASEIRDYFVQLYPLHASAIRKWAAWLLVMSLGILAVGPIAKMFRDRDPKR